MINDDKLYTWAKRLVVLPLILGVSVFLLWLPVRWAWLEMAGIMNIYFGMLCVAGALMLLAGHVRASLKVGMTRQQVLHDSAWLLGLVALDFVVAVILVVVASTIILAGVD